LILNPDLTINNDLVDKEGIPWLTATYVVSLITTNAGFTANFVHMFLWNYAEIKLGWSFINWKNARKALSLSTYKFWQATGTRTQEEKQILVDDPAIDPHYKLMIDYDEAPDSWYFLAFAASFIVSMVCIYVLKSSLPWWGLIIANIFLWIFLLFFGAQYAITGFQFNLGNTCSTLAGYLFPGRPLGRLNRSAY
jgi:OPT oligopeptide transporter protein